MTEITDFVSQVGFPISIVVFLGLGAWYVLRRCFNEQNGIITKVSESHVDFLQHAKQCNELNTETLQKLTETAKTAHNTANDRLLLLSQASATTSAMHAAGDHAMDVVDQICEKLDCLEETREPRQKIRNELAQIHRIERAV